MNGERVRTDAQKAREQSLFGELVDWKNETSGGIKRFNDVEAETLRELMDDGHIDPDMCQNYSPSTSELLAAAELFREEFGVVLLFGGYVVDPARSDSRLTITSVSSTEPLTGDAQREFVDRYRQADSFDMDGHAWWD